MIAALAGLWQVYVGKQGLSKTPPDRSDTFQKKSEL